MAADLTAAERDELRRRHGRELGPTGPEGQEQWCRCCGDDYPCPTIRAVGQVERMLMHLAMIFDGPETSQLTHSRAVRLLGLPTWEAAWEEQSALAADGRRLIAAECHRLHRQEVQE